MATILVASDGSPYVSLLEPFDSYRLTPLRESDAEEIYLILKDLRVASNLSSVPEPYTPEMAKEFLGTVMLPRIRRSNTLDWSDSEAVSSSLRTEMSLQTIRDSQGKLVGNISIRRNTWEWCWSQEAQEMWKENEAKEAGDESISYSLGKYRITIIEMTLTLANITTGFYLSPILQGHGIMTAALSTSLALAQRYMNIRHIEGICRADNVASRCVLEKNGLSLKETAIMPWKKGEQQRMRVLRRDCHLL